MNSIKVRLHVGKLIYSLQAFLNIQKSHNFILYLVLQSLAMSLDGVQIALNFPNALYSIPSTTKSAIGYYVKSPPSFL